MTMEVRNGKNSLTRLIAGFVLIASSLLSLFHSSYWSLLTLLVGMTHISSAVFGFCPMELFLSRVLKLPVRGSD